MPLSPRLQSHNGVLKEGLVLLRKGHKELPKKLLRLEEDGAGASAQLATHQVSDVCG